jgi:PTH1 family peptidyl-tRNA hydrolase
VNLVVGLGNPGPRYARTRHNIGFLVVERLAERHGATVEKKLFGALVGDAALGGARGAGRSDGRLILAMPQQFMNLSGQPTASIMGFYKIPSPDVIVVHDDMDLPFGRLRVRKGGGHGGHNGVRDIQRCAGADFVRVRVGVGRPPEFPGAAGNVRMDPADYVLSNWSADEAAQLDSVIDNAADAVESVARVGLDRTMNTFNTAPPIPGGAA